MFYLTKKEHILKEYTEDPNTVKKISPGTIPSLELS